MLKIHDVTQNSGDWLQLRVGIPTASSFDKIITPTGKKSTQADKYANILLAEIITGEAVNTFVGNAHTDRGKKLEPDAVACYELTSGNKTEIVGFATNSGVGCSPDRLIGNDGLLEVKCPAIYTHIEYMLNNEVESSYIPQVQGQLYVTDRKWCDWMSYHPDLEPVIIRVMRDEEYLTKMAVYMAEFFELLKSKKERLVNLGYTI